MTSRAAPGLIVPFCKPDFDRRERAYVAAVLDGGGLEGAGRFTRAGEAFLTDILKCQSALIVPSCTAALEMMGLVLDLRPGDEVVMPSFTFVSTANAIALRGAVPVFVDIDPETLNIDPVAAERAISPRTRAIMVVHYGGVACDMDAFADICSRHDLILLEDAAQALGSSWKGRPLGSFGAYGAISFHHTKNVSCGEGGALIVNDGGDGRLAEILREKGTNRGDFLRGTAGKYEWISLGSSYLLSELTAAVLMGQFERMDELLSRRMRLWEAYDVAFGYYSGVRRPKVPLEALHNAHIYHLRLPDHAMRQALCAYLREKGVVASPHYVPLHSTPGGHRFGKAAGPFTHTNLAAQTLVRLPLFSSMSDAQQVMVIELTCEFLDRSGVH